MGFTSSLLVLQVIVIAVGVALLAVHERYLTFALAISPSELYFDKQAAKAKKIGKRNRGLSWRSLVAYAPGLHSTGNIDVPFISFVGSEPQDNTVFLKAAPRRRRMPISVHTCAEGEEICISAWSRGWRGC